MRPKSYREAGVDVSKGDAFADFVRQFPSSAVSKSIGAFSGAVPIDPGKYTAPLLLSTTDGVGTKLLVAQKLRKYDTVGIDLVAMSVNDLIVCGAEPLSFLDYIAVGRIEGDLLQEIIRGVIRGCEIAGCTLAGGETAELPDMYGPGEFDLAGFCTGIVDQTELLPKKSLMHAGDIILGLPSNGIHSNGYSLARKAIPESDSKSWEELLRPTKIYVSEMRRLLSTGAVLGAAHVTGGGLIENFVRIVPDGLRPEFTWDWHVPEIFRVIADSAQVPTEEMRSTFNMGIGVALVVSRDDLQRVMDAANGAQVHCVKIGELTLG